jgi:hypothetical protein
MKPGIPHIVDLLKHGDDMDQISAIHAFADLADYRWQSFIYFIQLKSDMLSQPSSMRR